MDKPRRSVLEDGLLIALVGAGLVAAWFLVLDVVRGEPFFTPSLLGRAVFDGIPVTDLSVDVKSVFAYSGLHVLMFLVVGWFVALMFKEFEENPHFGIAYVLVYAVFMVTVFGVEIAMMPDIIGNLGTWTVAVGNLLAAVGMFWFALYRYPGSIRYMIEAWHE